MFQDYAIDKNEYLQLAEKILNVMFEKSFTLGNNYRSCMDCLFEKRMINLLITVMLEEIFIMGKLV